MNKLSPKHVHDCDCCNFQGQIVASETLCDVYHCPQGGSIVARFGVDGDYSSMPLDILQNNEIGTNTIIGKAFELYNARKNLSPSTGRKLSTLAPLI